MTQENDDEDLGEIFDIRRSVPVHDPIHTQSGEQNCTEQHGGEMAPVR